MIGARMSGAHPTLERILQTGMAFMPAKILTGAIRMGLFTHLAGGPMSGAGIAKARGPHSRGLCDFLDAQFALGFLGREGLLDTASYRNTVETGTFLDRYKPSYVGGILEMAIDCLYPSWGDLETALRTAVPQNEIRHEARTLSPSCTRTRSGWTSSWRRWPVCSSETSRRRWRPSISPVAAHHCDVGGASGAQAIQVARWHPHMHCIIVDLASVEPITKRRITMAGMGDRVEARVLDLFKGPWPSVDIITTGGVLHDWGLPEKMHPIRLTHAALNEGARWSPSRTSSTMRVGKTRWPDDVAEHADRDDRRLRLYRRRLCTPGREAGFRETAVLPLTGPGSAAIARK